MWSKTRVVVPIVCQVVGALTISFGVGCLVGWAWASITVGGSLLVAGTLMEIPS